MSNVIDGVMKEILDGCKKKAKREVRAEVAKLKRENTRLSKEVSSLKKEIADLKKPINKAQTALKNSEAALAKREKQIADAAQKLMNFDRAVQNIRNKTIGQLAGTGDTTYNYWSNTQQQQREALKAIRDQFKKRKKPTTKRLKRVRVRRPLRKRRRS